MNQSSEKLEEILRDYAGLPEYSEMPIPKVSTKSLFGDYPIHIAAVRGDIAEISILLDNGADINALGEHSYTPLHDAVEQGHLDAVRFLVNRGANINIKSEFDMTPLELADSLNRNEIYYFLKGQKD